MQLFAQIHMNRRRKLQITYKLLDFTLRSFILLTKFFTGTFIRNRSRKRPLIRSYRTINKTYCNKQLLDFFCCEWYICIYNIKILIFSFSFQLFFSTLKFLLQRIYCSRNYRISSNYLWQILTRNVPSIRLRNDSWKCFIYNIIDPRNAWIRSTGHFISTVKHVHIVYNALALENDRGDKIKSVDILFRAIFYLVEYE